MPSDVSRRKTLVVKMGSSSVTKQSGPDPVLLARALESALTAQGHGWDVVLVSSGAVSSGRALFARGRGAEDAPISQRLAAAVGQTLLMGFYRSVAELSGSHVAQILIGESDLGSPTQMAHVAEAIRHALDAGVVPVVNGNDTIDSAGSDNDGVAAGLAMLLGADLLLLLTDVPGVFASSIADGVHLESLTVAELRKIAVQKGGTGRGGIRSKLRAAELAAHNGVATRIAGARTADVILAAIDGPGPGTLIEAVHTHPSTENRWVSGVATARGRVEINLEAERSIAAGSSLFASGIKRVSGEFTRGDVIEVRALGGELLGRGVSRVSSRLLTLVRALRVDEIARVFVAVLANFAGLPADGAATPEPQERHQLVRALEYASGLSYEHGRSAALEIVSLFPSESVAGLLGVTTGEIEETLVERYTRLVRTLPIVQNDQIFVFAPGGIGEASVEAPLGSPTA
ncbi:glutamate 5-kinase [Microbacteriaceae bacterium VKM Ac-2855]|nr:glutamate 5-kinase [Microbacteriaceae bacterium VKM Ac-2855]